MTKLDLQWLDQIDSTNSELLRRFRAGDVREQALAAHVQNAGRGRNGKSWDQTPRALYYSQLLQLRCRLAQCAPLALALAVETCGVLESLWPDHRGRISIKWPNDLWLDRLKFSGLLLEVAGGSTLETWIVAGIGVNLAPAPEKKETTYQSTDLQSAGLTLAANDVAAALAPRWQQASQQFATSGLTPWLEGWRQRDALRGRTVTLSDSDAVFDCDGVDAQGALLLRAADGAKRCVQAGDVQLSTRVVSA